MEQGRWLIDVASVRMKPKSRVHVMEQGPWKNRLVCGRTYNDRIRLVELDQAPVHPDLCNKCRVRLVVEINYRWWAAQPLPRGYQYTFGFLWE